MFNLDDILKRTSLNPTKTLVLRNSTSELGKAIYWIADERLDLFRAYQHTQGAGLTSAMKSAKHIISCIGHQTDQAVFVSIFDILGYQSITTKQFVELAEHQELAKQRL